MRLYKLIPISAVAAALILVPTLAAQTAQATDTAAKAEKKAKKKAKKTEEQSSEATATEKTKEATPETPKASKSKTGSAQRMMPTVSDSEIAAAKASGQVWVNTQTGVYHTGGKWYGTTKQGKFMTEDEAKKAGYRAAKSGQ